MVRPVNHFSEIEGKEKRGIKYEISRSWWWWSWGNQGEKGPKDQRVRKLEIREDVKRGDTGDVKGTVDGAEMVVVRNQAKGREKTEKEEKEEDGRGEEKRKKTLETRGRREALRHGRLASSSSDPIEDGDDLTMQSTPPTSDGGCLGAEQINPGLDTYFVTRVES
ncbi:hypothetical protein An01g04460 [Aspergillus niger]|uniref:Uncharacterized protein n=2 Tax=Aspergillus niger TaxID=5061 RepID=A2Q8I5_ASPNC|nr:hypothetical protein An01g04460 [Aspergillus niger]CAK36982.1 hypothetical protein An01g04460 [Aspergillus niger]